jgi:hypothetical protein
MLQVHKPARSGIDALLSDPRVRQVTHEAETRYCEADLRAVLADLEPPFEGGEMLSFEGVLRLILSLDTPRAQRLKNRIAAAALERFEEAEDPELALLRTRRAYENQGRSRQWIDQRMRSVSARHELTGEWYRRGVRDGDQFRALTNEMTAAAFGMDVESYRRYKGLFRTGQNLRDHMTDLELSLTSLAETAAVELHRNRRSSGFDALLLDAKDSGRLIAGTRREIEQQIGRSVVSAVNNLSEGASHAPQQSHRMRAPREAA